MSGKRKKVGEKLSSVDMVIGWNNTPNGTPLGYFSNLPPSETSYVAYDEDFFQDISTSKGKRVRIVDNAEWSDV